MPSSTTSAEAAYRRATGLVNKLEQRPDQRLHEILITALFLADLRQYRLPVGGHVRSTGHLRQGMNQRPSGLRGVDIAPLFAQETTLEQQLDNPCAGRFRAEAVEAYLRPRPVARNRASREANIEAAVAAARTVLEAA